MLGSRPERTQAPPTLLVPPGDGCREGEFQTGSGDIFLVTKPVCSQREGLLALWECRCPEGTRQRLGQPGLAFPAQHSVCCAPAPLQPSAQLSTGGMQPWVQPSEFLVQLGQGKPGKDLFPSAAFIHPFLPAVTHLCCLVISLHPGYLEKCFLKIASRFFRYYSVQL